MVNKDLMLIAFDKTPSAANRVQLAGTAEIGGIPAVRYKGPSKN